MSTLRWGTGNTLHRVNGRQSQWSFSDAWVLAAAAVSGRRWCDLSNLIASADALNHDIPTEEVIEHSVGRLTASGLMETSGLRVRLTRAGKRLVSKRRRALFKQAQSVLALLGQQTLTDGHWDLPSGAWEEAYEAYWQRSGARE